MELYKIIPNNGHYELWIWGRLYSTADTWEEAHADWEEYLNRVDVKGSK